MSDSACNPSVVPVAHTRPAPKEPLLGGPVLIGDAVTPLAGTTLLALLWRISDR